jgi:hypothetical protein
MTAGGKDGRFPTHIGVVLSVQTSANHMGIKTMARGGITPEMFTGPSQQAFMHLDRNGGSVHARFDTPNSNKKPSTDGLFMVACAAEQFGYHLAHAEKAAPPIRIRRVRPTVTVTV